MKIVEAVFQITNIFNFFLMWTTLHFEGRSKKKLKNKKKERKRETRNIYKGTPDIEFEKDWSVGLDATYVTWETENLKLFF